jgi:hypothetical protein
MVYQLGLLSMADWISNRIIVTFMVSSTIPAIDTGKRIGRLEYGGEHTQAFVVPMEQQSLSEATRLYAAAAVPLVLAHHLQRPPYRLAVTCERGRPPLQHGVGAKRARILK